MKIKYARNISTDKVNSREIVWKLHSLMKKSNFTDVCHFYYLFTLE